MAARGDGHEGDELGADWLFGQLADESSADEPEPPQSAQRSAWWSRRGRSGETAPVEPIQEGGADASGGTPLADSWPAAPQPAASQPAASAPAGSAPAPKEESLDWFSLAEPAAPLAGAAPASPEPARPEPVQPSRPEQAPVDAVPNPFWAPAPTPPVTHPPVTQAPPSDPVLTSVEPPVTPRLAAEPPVPGPATPTAPFALTWGDEPAAAPPVEPAPSAPSAPFSTPTPPVFPGEAFPTPAAPADPAAPFSSTDSPPQPSNDAPQGLLDAPRRPRTWDEIAAGTASVPEAPAAPAPVSPTTPTPPAQPVQTGAELGADWRAVPSEPAAAIPERPAAPAPKAFDEELWSALNEPDAGPAAPAAGTDAGRHDFRRAAAAGAAGAAFAAGAGAADEAPPVATPPTATPPFEGIAPRQPFPAFASADRVDPATEPVPPVDDLLASLTRPAPRPEPTTPAPAAGIGFGVAADERHDAALPAADVAGATAFSETSSLAGLARLPDFAVSAGVGAAPAAATGAEADHSDADDDPLGLGFRDAAPASERQPDLSGGAGFHGATEFDDDDDADGAEDEAYDWGLVGDPNGVDPRASDGPRDTAGMLETGSTAAVATGVGAAIAADRFATAEPEEADPLDSWLGGQGAGEASDRFAAAGVPAAASAAQPSPRRSGDASGGDAPGGGVPTGGASSTGGGRPPRPLLWIAGGLALVVVLAGLFFLGSKLPIGSSSTASGSATVTAPKDSAAAEAPAPTAAQPAGVHAWNTLFGGECVEPFTDAWAQEYTVVDCATPHTAQLVLRGTLAGDAAAAYPGEAELATQLTASCRAPGVFDDAAIAGIDDLQVLFSYPLADQWAAGERTFYCFADRSGGEPLTASIAGPTPSQVAAG